MKGEKIPVMENNLKNLEEDSLDKELDKIRKRRLNNDKWNNSY